MGGPAPPPPWQRGWVRDQVHHHGDRVALLTAAGGSYALCWTETSAGELVFAETAEDLLAYWINGYRDGDAAGRVGLRARNAVTVRARLAAQLVVDADLDEIPDLASSDAAVPLVLLKGMYRPDTDRIPPISGIDGDVWEPSNIIWLRNG